MSSELMPAEVTPSAPTSHAPAVEHPTPGEAVPGPNAGGSSELLRLAAPLILSQSFMTVQVFVDTVLLSWHNLDEMTASFPAVMWYWLLFGLLQATAGYTSTFVAQYTGAERPHRVGPAVWQGIYFACVAGVLFMFVAPLAPYLIALNEHGPKLEPLETTYLQCLAFAAWPMLLIAAINGFFAGRGQTWTVLAIEVFGTAINVALAMVLIFGYDPIPEMGIAGAGIATVVGSWAAALCALVVFLLPRHHGYGTLSGWRLDVDLFRRLLRFGGPAGLQVFLDVMVFHLFTLFIGRLGETALGATTLAIRLNMVAFLPMMGLGQAVCILVGQRLGADRPDLAQRSTFTGLRWMFGYMCVVAFVYLAFPNSLIAIFASEGGSAQFDALSAIVPTLLMCVAIYSLADAVNLTFAFALRGAGDTWFVSLLTFTLAWPILVIPTYVVVAMQASLYWAWGFATAHIIVMALCFILRFRTGKWKSMRVIESAAHV